MIIIHAKALDALSKEELHKLSSFLTKGGDKIMKAKKKGLTRNQKLKLNKTAKAKKKVKATKK